VIEPSVADKAERSQAMANRIKQLIKPRSFSRFAIVGVINTCMGIGLFPLVDWLTLHAIGHNRLLVITYILCAISAFLLHRFFTFESRGSYRHEITKYVILTSVTFAVNYILLNVSLRYVDMSVDLVQTLISSLIGITLMVANYLGLNHLVFAKETNANHSPRPD